ncbi:hypothetical protein Vadar_001717 [Vaccinium darrowii]|uniref:Uncharacterized protein n=1 Tax=Vaccinium darrowii TaxID=229202 RepID=A0ACB7Z8R3_9ERIC|nr:hypothetical protein Vadar_001717 [Vaccinium darrowii]
MLKPAQRYLTLRALGAPAVLLSLAMQGVFRGFKDTRTPLYAMERGTRTLVVVVVGDGELRRRWQESGDWRKEFGHGASGTVNIIPQLHLIGHLEADVAIANAHGMWIEERKLFVKRASFGQGEKAEPHNQKMHLHRDLMKTNSHLLDSSPTGKRTKEDQPIMSLPHGKSYANVVKGVTEAKGLVKENAITLRMQEEETAWLSTSVVAKSHLDVTVDDLAKNLNLELMLKVQNIEGGAEMVALAGGLRNHFGHFGLDPIYYQSILFFVATMATETPPRHVFICIVLASTIPTLITGCFLVSVLGFSATEVLKAQVMGIAGCHRSNLHAVIDVLDSACMGDCCFYHF